MEHKVKHLMYIPWTGLGNYAGFRGNRWLINRLKVFEQFVLPSLLGQTNKDFIVWCSWRFEEKRNPLVLAFIERMEQSGLEFVHTFHGCCFWDDKYPDVVARARLLTSLHGSLGDLLDVVGGVDYVLMTIQPSDDCYRSDAVGGIQNVFKQNKDLQAVGFEKGYITNYKTLEVKEYNPTTNPPFFTIKFPKAIFVDPIKHAEYTGPYKSHEYIAQHLKYGIIKERGFLVGCHFDNISTVFDHPYAGDSVPREILNQFGLENAKPLEIPFSVRRLVFSKLPYGVKRKLRYLAGEKLWIGRSLFSIVYNFLRG